MPHLKLFFLGSPQLEIDGVSRDCDSKKGLALLAYLAVSGQSHSRDALSTLLWPDSDQSRARSYLRHALWSLNKLLGKGWLEVSREQVELNPEADIWLDVNAFRQDVVVTAETEGDDLTRLAGAVELYRDDFLSGFTLPNAPAFDEWQFFQTEELRETLAGALERLVWGYSRQSEYETAIPYGRRWVALDPLHEPAQRHLMQLYGEAGQKAVALRQYEEYAALLEKELGLPPEEETTTLYEAIKARRIVEPFLKADEPGGESRLRPGEIQEKNVVVPPPPETSIPTTSFLDDALPIAAEDRVFVARQEELDRLDVYLETALAGQSRIAFVIGDAGQGKTTLLQAFARHAQQTHPDLVVAGGNCNAYTGLGDPYLPFREVLELLTGDVEARAVLGTLQRGQARRLWHMLPATVQVLLKQGPDLLDTFVPAQALWSRATAYTPEKPPWLSQLGALVNQRGPTNAQQNALHEQYARVIQTLANQLPLLLLLLDDLQWADPGSISLLFHLGRRLTDHRVMILGAYRASEVAIGRDGEPHPLARIVHEFQRNFGDITLDLSQVEGQAFVNALLDSEPNRLGPFFRQILYQQTGGHPLFTIELLRDMQERGDLFQDKAGVWEAQPSLNWNALPARVEGAIGERISRLAAPLRELLRVASVEGEEFTAEVVAQVLNLDEREAVRRLSGELDKTHALVQAIGIKRAGGRRLSRYRFRHILIQLYLYNLLDEVERSYLHESVGHLLEQLYEGQTEEIAVQLARHFQEAELISKAVHYLQQAGDAAARVYANNPEAIAYYKRALELVKQDRACLKNRTGQELTQLYTHLGRTFELDSQFDQALATYEDMERLARQYGYLSMVLASLMARTTLYAVPTLLHDPTRGQILGEEALSLAHELDDPTAEVKILWNLSKVYQYSNKLPKAIDYSERALTMARRHNLHEQIAFALNDLADCYWIGGYFDRGKAANSEAIERWRDLDNLPMLADALSTACSIHVFSGEYNQAIVVAQEALEISQSIDNLWGRSQSRFRVGYAHWERGQPDRAIANMEESIRLSDLSGFVIPLITTRSDLALVYSDLGAIKAGLEIAQLALTTAETQAPLFRAYALGALIRLHLMSANVKGAKAAVEQGYKDPNREGFPVYFAFFRLADGELALKQGDYERALIATDSLLTDLRQFGMRSLIPSALFLQGQILQGLDREQEAHQRLREARIAAEAIGSRRILWQILFTLSQFEADPAEAEGLRKQAQEIVDDIADNVGDPELRASFLGLPDVQAVFA